MSVAGALKLLPTYAENAMRAVNMQCERRGGAPFPLPSFHPVAEFCFWRAAAEPLPLVACLSDIQHLRVVFRSMWKRTATMADYCREPKPERVQAGWQRRGFAFNRGVEYFQRSNGSSIADAASRICNTLALTFIAF